MQVEAWRGEYYLYHRRSEAIWGAGLLGGAERFNSASRYSFLDLVSWD